MTRFARAKGSKSSNEKKPEEPTSWSEMRNSMLAKTLRKPEKEIISTHEAPIKDNASVKTEWASLGDDAVGGSSSLLKQHLGKNNDSFSSSKDVKREKKKKKSQNDSELNSAVNDEPKSEKKIKKKKYSPNQDAEYEVKVKKRKLTESDLDSENSLSKKKKLKNKEVGFKEKKEQMQENLENKDKVKKHNVNNRNFKGENNFNNFKRENNSKNFKREKGNFNSKMGKNEMFEKKFKNRNFQERNSAVEELIINGEKIPITKFQGFYVTLEDAERLRKLRSEMIKEGIPKNKLEAAIKLERRRAEKALSRLKKSVCFHCRGHGHLLSNCPNLIEKENTGTGICYKCGSTEHSASECKVVRGTNYQFAECFICKEQGHIARQCPDNPRGLYPQGGGCRECGDVTHLRKDCPKVQAQKAEDVITVGLRSDRDLECLDEEINNREQSNMKKKVKKSSTVKF